MTPSASEKSAYRRKGLCNAFSCKTNGSLCSLPENSQICGWEQDRQTSFKVRCMSSFLSRIWQRVLRPTGYIGRDLQGNRFYERPINGNEDVGLRKTKRTVKYQQKGQNLWDLASNSQTLPVQWLAWLSHTRIRAPTLEELSQDIARQERLRLNVARLKAQEAEERLRLQSPQTSEQPIKDAPSQTKDDALPKPPSTDKYQPETWTPRLSRRGG